MDEQHTDGDEIEIRVRGPIHEPGVGQSECMSAAPDPVSADQAVLLNTPFFVEGLNYGDLIRLGPPDEIGLRPIVEVLVASGHSRILVLTGDLGIHGLYEHLRHLFPDCALCIEGDGDHLLSVSVHPAFEPEAVFDEIAEWLDDECMGDDEGVGLSEIIESYVGPVVWPSTPSSYR